VIQTSAMDCGPAALASLLDGFGIGINTGRLREACQTAVDGTSIDRLETLAVSLGLEADQIMLPVDHLLLPEAEALPAIVLVKVPSGLTHFVVAWRAHGALVQVMDPARGRRWVRRASFLESVHRHEISGAPSCCAWPGRLASTRPSAPPCRASCAPPSRSRARGPGAALVRLLSRDGPWRWSALALGVGLMAVGAVAEGLLFRALIDLGVGRGGGRPGGSSNLRPGPSGA
jgi:predicted double-glycine peptidase